VLGHVGWPLEARLAILQGPYAFFEYVQRPRQHVPDEGLMSRLGNHNHDKILESSLHHTTERGGHNPELYHGTDDAHVEGLGIFTEMPRKEI